MFHYVDGEAGGKEAELMIVVADGGDGVDYILVKYETVGEKSDEQLVVDVFLRAVEFLIVISRRDDEMRFYVVAVFLEHQLQYGGIAGNADAFSLFIYQVLASDKLVEKVRVLVETDVAAPVVVPCDLESHFFSDGIDASQKL